MMKLLVCNFVEFITVKCDQDLKSLGLGKHGDVCAFPRFAVVLPLLILLLAQWRQKEDHSSTISSKMN